MIRAIFIDAAGGRSIVVFLEEWTLEKNLATGAAAVALSATKGKGSDDLVLTKVGADESAKLALRLAGSKPGIFDGSRASCGCQAFFKRALP